MVTRRTARSKGRQFEYCVYNILEPIFKNKVYLTAERGFIKQYDLVVEGRYVIECKFHRTFSWNELLKLFKKLESKTPKDLTPLLVFKSNRQPILVMHRNMIGIIVSEFTDYLNSYAAK